jgi:hypothetical protein
MKTLVYLWYPFHCIAALIGAALIFCMALLLCGIIGVPLLVMALAQVFEHYGENAGIIAVAATAYCLFAGASWMSRGDTCILLDAVD